MPQPPPATNNNYRAWKSPKEVLMQKTQKFCADFEYVNLKIGLWEIFEKNHHFSSHESRNVLKLPFWPERFRKLANLFSFPSAEFVSAGTPFWSAGAVGSWPGKGKKLQNPRWHPIQLSICTVCQMSKKMICLSLTSVFTQAILFLFFGVICLYEEIFSSFAAAET